MPLRPDPTFYPSPASAAAGPVEELAYVVTLDVGANGDRRPDGLSVVDLKEGSSSYGTVVGRLEMPNVGDELHHFGWNACSSALCPWAPHPHVERRYLLVPGLRSSRIHVVDVKDDPHAPKLVKVIEAEDLAKRTGYSRPHTSHCGPDGLYVSALGAPDGGGPGGVLLLDHDSFDPLGRWELDRGPQQLAYDVWWNIGFDTLLTSEWGLPNMVEDGINPELLLSNQYGHQLHVWDMRKRRHKQAIDLGAEHQMVLELRPAHDPTRPYGFVGVVVSTADLSASVWLWRRGDDGQVRVDKVISIPAEPAEADQLPDALKPFGAVPPLITDIALSVDDRSLYVSCWGTGELKRFDVTDPANPRETGSVRLGGIVGKAPHPASGPVNGGPQMVEVSRDGRRVYLTNSLYASCWTTMRVSSRELGLWSFLMSTAHGAGLMVAPVVLGLQSSLADAHVEEHDKMDVAMATHGSVATSALGLVVHVGVMLLVMGLVAVFVYERIGLQVLRRAWLNTDHLWAGAFVVAGVVTLVS